MGLQAYRKKRDFRKTSEPAPKIKAGKGHSFCVQKHDATRLHYDFRLELDGVLKSWAVTKGPSLDPADKRLAVHVEDHPVSYGDFEGTIPKGQYGGGTVMLWDEGEWEPVGDPHAGLKKGHLVFDLHGNRLRGRWALIRMRGKPGEKRENWLLIKEKDAKSRKGARAESFLNDNAFSVKTKRTMEEIAEGDHVWQSNRSSDMNDLAQTYDAVELATLVTEPPAGKDWIHEVKFDGYRVLCFIDHGSVMIRTRNGNDWTARFSAIAEGLAKLKAKTAVLDGEAVLLDEKGLSHFQGLQEALGEGGRADGIQGYFFDLLHLDGEDLRGLPLTERKEKLEKLLARLPKNGAIHYSDHLEGTGDVLKKACGMGLEGIVSKKKTARYAGSRGKSWLKSKCGQRQEFVIVGYTASKNGPRAVGALHVAYTKNGKLAYAGKVGTGFSVKTAETMRDMLKPLAVDKPLAGNIPAEARRGTTWVTPKLLCEVSFAQWTNDGRIRHSSFEGLRADKKPQEVVHEKPAETRQVVKKEAAKKETAKKKTGIVEVAGVTISHPDRQIFEGVTKAELAEYYALAAPAMLREIRGRPISLLRCPSGMSAECFFQRNPDAYMKETVKPFSFLHKGKTHEYLYVEDEQGLVFLIQMGVIEIHPWGAAAKRIDYPLRLVFDLDPDEGIPFEAVRLAALDVRARLKALKLESFPRVTGGKGIHVMVPLAGKQKWPAVKDFARRFVEQMAADAPDAYVATMSKQKRGGKIFVDFFRNDYTATAIADYSVRARPGAPVAVPVSWAELAKLSSAHDFGIPEATARLRRKKQPDGRHTLRQTLPLR